MPSSFTRILSLGKLQLYTSLSSDEYQTAIVGEVSAAYKTEPVKHQTSTSSKGPREANMEKRVCVLDDKEIVARTSGAVLNEWSD